VCVCVCVCVCVHTYGASVCMYIQAIVAPLIYACLRWAACDACTCFVWRARTCLLSYLNVRWLEVKKQFIKAIVVLMRNKVAKTSTDTYTCTPTYTQTHTHTHTCAHTQNTHARRYTHILLPHLSIDAAL
jgi:carbohydrate-binding DOMON domain-containing protein